MKKITKIWNSLDIILFIVLMLITFINFILNNIQPNNLTIMVILLLAITIDKKYKY